MKYSGPNVVTAGKKMDHLNQCPHYNSLGLCKDDQDFYPDATDNDSVKDN
jgi:hypothetical protein